jgi:Fic family protein
MVRKTLSDIDKLKSRWDAEQPLDMTVQDKLWQHWKITHTFHSLALEGYTLTLEDVTKSVKNELLLKAKPKLERHFILNHAEAIDSISLLSEKRVLFTLSNAFFFQNALFTDLRPDEDLMKLREGDVLGEERLATTKAMLKLVTDLEYKEAHPVVKAARTHLGLTMIHPFDDMNGCIARLCMNLMLARDGYPLALIPLETKTVYLDALELASKNRPSSFDEFVANRMKESLEASLDFIKR